MGSIRHSFRYQEKKGSKGLSRPQARLADDLFALDPRIRYVALLDRNHKLVESRMRTSVASFTRKLRPEDHGKRPPANTRHTVTARSPQRTTKPHIRTIRKNRHEIPNTQ